VNNIELLYLKVLRSFKVF